MVCSIGSGKMAVMARILAAVSFSKIISEEVGSQKLTAKYVQRELCEADEANLLDEEDMHIYDLMPLTDPLHLVCCNACKKPIKISQYAAHAEICKSVRIAEEMVSELNGGSGHKKRPKKERKKLTAAYTSMTSEEQKRLDSTEADIKRNSSCVDGAPTIDGSEVSPGIPDYSTNAIPPPTKRSKLIPAEVVDKTVHLRVDSGVAKSSCLNTQGAHTCEGLKGSTGRCKPFSEPVQVHGFCLQLQSADIPAPLGTKMFYSLRNHRLRSAVKCMYYETFSEEQSDDVHLNASQGDELGQVSCPTNSHGELKSKLMHGEKQSSGVVTSVRKPQQVLADCSDVYMGKSGHIPARDFSNQDPVTNSQATSLGNMRSNYLPQSFSFAGNSGSSLGTMEQPKGSVPVT